MAACLQYYVLLREDGSPIESTMQGYTQVGSGPIGLPCNRTGCTYVKLKTSAYTAPDGYHQCFFSDGKRYFYRINSQGQIVPNSLFGSLTYPTNPGSCGYFIEYKSYCPNE